MCIEGGVWKKARARLVFGDVICPSWIQLQRNVNIELNTRWHNGGIINELNISMNVFALISFLRPHSIYRVLVEENLESTRYKKSSNHVLKENIKQTIICKILSKIKAYNTRYSHSVSRHSTDRARRSFTSVFRREPVFSTWYGRRRFQWHFEHFQIIFIFSNYLSV